MGCHVMHKVVHRPRHEALISIKTQAAVASLAAPGGYCTKPSRYFAEPTALTDDHPLSMPHASTVPTAPRAAGQHSYRKWHACFSAYRDRTSRQIQIRRQAPTKPAIRYPIQPASTMWK